MTTILIADDHQILREGMKKSFESAGEQVIAQAANGEEAVALAAETNPDVILMDLSMPILDGIGATRRICEDNPEARIVILTMHDEPEMTRQALDAGAVGYLTKGLSFADVLATVRAAAAGETALTSGLATSMLNQIRRSEVPTKPLLSDRQVQILQRIADGKTTKEVARELGITQKTVHNHLNAIYRKLDTQNLTHAVLSAVKLGLIELS